MCIYIKDKFWLQLYNMKKFLKKGVYLLGGIILLASDVIYAQCPASYTSAAINWDFHYFRVNPPTGTSFAIGTTSATLAYTPTLNGINATNTGEAGSFGAGADIQFTGNGTVTLTFKTEVQNVKFSLYDIDLSQVATIAATNAASVAQTVTVGKNFRCYTYCCIGYSGFRYSNCSRRG